MLFDFKTRRTRQTRSRKSENDGESEDEDVEICKYDVVELSVSSAALQSVTLVPVTGVLTNGDFLASNIRWFRQRGLFGIKHTVVFTDWEGH